MSKPLTYRKPNGEWGIEGVDMATLPPKVYGALCKLKDIEHPCCPSNAEAIRAAKTTQEMARIIAKRCSIGDCLEDQCCGCERCYRDWLEQPYEEELYEPEG